MFGVIIPNGKSCALKGLIGTVSGSTIVAGEARKHRFPVGLFLRITGSMLKWWVQVKHPDTIIILIYAYNTSHRISSSSC